jgi:hypothetical protein
MVTTIKKGSTKAEIQSLFEEMESHLYKGKGFDAYKFCGTVKFDDDAMNIQKTLRNEWK